MKLRLYLSTSEEVFSSDPANQGLDEAIQLLASHREGGLDYQRIDVNLLTDKDIQEAYMEAIYPSVRRKFGIRRVFGSRRRVGCFFGRGIPALLVYDGSEHPINVYPHEELGRIVTIKEFSETLVKKERVASG